MVALRPLLVLALLAVACEGERPDGDQQSQVAAGPQRAPHEQLDLPSLSACGICHEQVYLEWQTSLHARAWLDPNTRMATGDFARVECRPCHAPQAVLRTGLERQALVRAENREDGVHCLCCHGLEDGVAATRTVAGAPCRPRFDPRLSRAALCAPCHAHRQGTLQEFAGSDARALGLGCIDCHMPRRSDRPGRSHAGTGGENELFVRTALRWSAAVEGNAAVVTLHNRTPHKLPAESASRALVVRVDFSDGTREYRTMRRPAASELRPDSRLLPEQTLALRFEFPDETAWAEVQVLFKTFPVMPDEAAYPLGRKRLDRTR